MRTLLKNKQKLLYSNQSVEIPIYQTDEDGNILYDGYTDEDGNFFPYLDANDNKIPLLTGETEVLFKEPLPLLASVSMSGGEAEAVAYGLTTDSYSAVAIMELNIAPLKEGALVWLNSKPVYKYDGQEISIDVNDEQITGRFVEKTSADFVVMKLSPSLNFLKVILQAVNK